MRLSGWFRLWIVCAAIMWASGGFLLYGHLRNGGWPSLDTLCFGDLPLSIADGSAPEPRSALGGADLLALIDAERERQQTQTGAPRESQPGSAQLGLSPDVIFNAPRIELPTGLATRDFGRLCTAEELSVRKADYHSQLFQHVIQYTIATLLILIAPLSLIFGFGVVRWVWRGFRRP